MYKMLLLQISERLLQEDKVKLQNWAASNYSVEVSEDAYPDLGRNGQKASHHFVEPKSAPRFL